MHPPSSPTPPPSPPQTPPSTLLWCVWSPSLSPSPTPSFHSTYLMHNECMQDVLFLVQPRPLTYCCTILHGSRCATALQKAASILPRWMPMLIPPKPWSAPNIGGYLSNQSLIMRVRGSTMQINQLFTQHRQGKLSQVRTALPHMHTFWWEGEPRGGGGGGLHCSACTPVVAC